MPKTYIEKTVVEFEKVWIESFNEPSWGETGKKIEAFLTQAITSQAQMMVEEITKIPIAKRNPSVFFSSNIQDHLEDALLAGEERFREKTCKALSEILTSYKERGLTHSH